MSFETDKMTPDLLAALTEDERHWWKTRAERGLGLDGTDVATLLVTIARLRTDVRRIREAWRMQVER